MMKKEVDAKQLLKILVGVAWLDGIIQPEERNYLRRMAANTGIADDPEIQSLLSELKPVKPAECYQWLEDYVGKNPSQKDYYGLLEAISALIYSDGDIPTQEAKLLTKVQLLDPSSESPKSTGDKVLKTIQKLYRKAISEHA
ncbi:MAG: TerB family tellurite resistance protein [Hydrococcus sp. C42_A2020_068]|nr:TerB family tellurite resistance protein [Hydrococcus sp. C42_A2020_068]